MTASLLLALRRRLWLLVLLPIVVGLVVFFTTPERDEDPTFVTTALVAADPTVEYRDQRIRQDALLIREDVVVTRAAELYGSDLPPDEFRNRIASEADVDAAVIRISAEGDSPDEVQEYVTAFADAFIDVVQARANESMVAEVIRAETAFNDADGAYEEFVAENAAGLDPASPDPAAVEQRDQLYNQRQAAKQVYDELITRAENLAATYEVISAPRGRRPAPSTLDMLGDPPVRAGAAVVITLLLLVIVLAALDRLRPRVIDRFQVEEAIDAPVLAMVSRRRRQGLRRLTRDRFQGPDAEAHRTLRVHLQFLARNGSAVPEANGQDPATAPAQQPVIAVVSPAPGDGKTTTAAMLALAFTEADVDTLVLGCDFRRPTVHEVFDVPLSPGLTDRRGIEPTPELAALIHTDPETGVRVLPSGRPSTHSHHVLADAQVVIRAAASVGRAVVLDTAPILVASETSQLAALADYVVLVAHAGRTSMRALTEAVTTLRLNDIEVSGVVLIGSPEASDYSYYYGGYAQREGDTGRTDTPGLAPHPEVAEATPR